MHWRNAAAVLTAMAASVLSFAQGGSADATTPHLSTPSGVIVTPGVGGVTVSWEPDLQTGVTYVVHSSPSGLRCSVVDSASCFMSDTSSTPYSFTVVAKGAEFKSSAPSTPTPPLAPHLVVVIAGQSNATGWQSFVTDPATRIDYFAPPYTNGADSHDLITWEPWAVYPTGSSSPVPLDSPQVCALGPPNTVFGPEIGLARQLWADTGRSVTIVKATYEGSDLAVNWSPSGSGTPPDGLFPAMVSDVIGLMSQDASGGQFDVLGGVYWYGGESDAAFPSFADVYRQNLKNFILALRQDLPMAKTAPIVLANEDITAYVDYSESQGALTASQVSQLLAQNSTVRAADDWAATSLKAVLEVDTAGLPRFDPPLVHLTNVGELTLGEEMAKVSEPLLP